MMYMTLLYTKGTSYSQSKGWNSSHHSSESNDIYTILHVAYTAIYQHIYHIEFVAPYFS